MKEYECFKRVHAMKIIRIETKITGNAVLHGDEEVRVDREWLKRHAPREGGYVIVCQDGYTSYSPEAAFESGYREAHDNGQ